MPLLYIPLNISKCCNYLNIPDSKYFNKYIYEFFEHLYDYNFCPFEITKNKNTKYICGNRIKDNEKYCKKHNKNDKINKKQIFYCISKSCRRSQCGRKVRSPNQLCVFHNKNDKKNISQNNYNYDGIIYEKYKFKDEITDIVKHTFNTDILYKIVDNIKDKNENLGNKSYYHFIYKKQIMLTEIPRLLHNPDNMKIIPYNEYGYETTNQYIKDRIKRYIKNKKKNKKKKNKKPKIEIVDKLKDNIENIEYNIKDNDFLFKDIIKFINLDRNENNEESIDEIIKFINCIKYNKYLKFYCNFIKTNIKKLLNLNNFSNTVYLNDFKYKKAIIFNKNKKNDLINILREINYELDIIPQKRISWFGNTMSIIDYSNKYIIDIEKTGIKIYKKEDTMKKNKLNIDQLFVFYC